MDQMNAGQNPATNVRTVPTRYGAALGGHWRPYRAGARVTGAQAAPANVAQCAAVGAHSRAAFAVRIPVGCTEVTLVVGRWVAFPPWTWNSSGVSTAPTGQATDELVERFVAVETITFTGAAESVWQVELDTYGDPVGAYVSNVVGTVDAADTVQTWVRGAK